MFTDVTGELSEGAIYIGGPTREMFRFLMNDLKQAGLFEEVKTT